MSKSDEESEDLPELDWEDASHRVALPTNLQLVMRVPETRLRWACDKRRETLAEHPEDARIIEQLGTYMKEWRYVGRERGSPATWRVLFYVERRWYATTIGRDAGGSLNVVTTFGSGKQRFLRNRLAGLVEVVERGR